MLEMARKARHLPLGTFDRHLGKIEARKSFRLGPTGVPRIAHDTGPQRIVRHLSKVEWHRAALSVSRVI
jgi:hypothetical protein